MSQFTPNPRRKKPEDYHALAASRGFTWLGPEVPNNRTKTKWQCREGHIWETRFSKGYGCPMCAILLRANKKRKSISLYHEIANERGFLFLGPYTGLTTDKVQWQCKTGHVFEMDYHHVANHRRGCPKCAGRHKTAGDYVALAARRDFIWLGPMVKRAHDKTQWQCQRGHVWSAHFTNIQSGKGCPHCRNENLIEALRLPESHYHELASKNNLRWAGSILPNSKQDTTWECLECSARFEVQYDYMQAFGGCRICKPFMRKDFRHYEIIARENNLAFIGPVPVDVKTATLWQCSNGHAFERTHDTIHKGSTDCPTCGGYVNGVATSQPHRDLHEMLGGEINYPTMGYYLDIALFSDLAKIVVEYDSWYYHQDKITEDIARDDALIAAGWRVLRVKAGTQLPHIEELDEAIARLLDGEVYVEIVMDEWRDHIG